MRVDFGHVDEVQDIDLVGGFGIGLRKIMLSEHHVLARRGFVALHRIFPLHFFTGLLVDPFVADRREVPLVEQGQRQLVRLFGSMQRDWDLHQPEAQAATPNSSRHSSAPVHRGCPTSASLSAFSPARAPSRSCRLCAGGAFALTHSRLELSHLALDTPFALHPWDWVRRLLMPVLPRSAVMHVARSPLAAFLKQSGIAEQQSQPLVIAFASGVILRQSSLLERIRAELRGLGAARLLPMSALALASLPELERTVS